MDGSGEVGGEGRVAEAVGAIGDFAGAVEDDDGGEGIDAEEGIEAVGEDGGRAGFYFFEVRRHEGFVIVAISSEEQNVFVARKFRGDFFVEGFEGAAGATPGGPKIHN